MTNFNWKDKTEQSRNNFIARFFGIIGEEISKIWLENEKSNFHNLGRPTIRWRDVDGKEKRVTLDFLLKEKEGNENYYIVEQKNFFSYKNGKLRTFNDSPEFEKSFESWNKSKVKSSNAWRVFRDFEKHQVKSVMTSKKEIIPLSKIKGSILIWSEIDLNESYFLNKLKKESSIKKVIGLTTIIKELNQENNVKFIDLVKEKENWINDVRQILKSN